MVVCVFGERAAVGAFNENTRPPMEPGVDQA